MEEETGVARHHVEVIGRLDNYITRTGFDVVPVVGMLAPTAGREVFHSMPGWRVTNARLRVLDPIGRTLCCLRVIPVPLPGESALEAGTARGGSRHAVVVEGAVARRLARGPLLAPVLNVGVRSLRVGPDGVRLGARTARWQLQQCSTPTGTRLTLTSPGSAVATNLFIPFGGGAEPACQ
jgi:hypothetical protein